MSDMKETTRWRVSAESVAVIILAALAAPMAIPTTRKLLGNNSGFLRDLGFLSGPSATLWAGSWLWQLLQPTSPSL
jgi:hypothetical protein